MRVINVDGQVWRFKVGRSHVEFQAPNGRKWVAACAAVIGCTESEWERGRWKGWAAVLPSNVADWIRSKLAVRRPSENT